MEGLRQIADREGIWSSPVKLRDLAEAYKVDKEQLDRDFEMFKGGAEGPLVDFLAEAWEETSDFVQNAKNVYGGSIQYQIHRVSRDAMHVLQFYDRMRISEALFDNGQKVLDFGCGSGFVGMSMAIVGRKVVLAEIDGLAPVYLNHRAKKYRIPLDVVPVVPGECPDIGVFDVIFSDSVLDVQPNLGDCVGWLCGMLNTGGTWVSLANISGEGTAKHPDHRLLGREQFLDILRDCGLEISHHRTFWWGEQMGPLLVIARKVGKRVVEKF